MLQESLPMLAQGESREALTWRQGLSVVVDGSRSQMFSLIQLLPLSLKPCHAASSPEILMTSN